MSTVHHEDNVTELLSAVFAQMRQHRDAAATALERDIVTVDEEEDDVVVDGVTNKMGKMDSSVSNMEHEIVGTQLEDLLKAPIFSARRRFRLSSAKAACVLDLDALKTEDESGSHTPSHSDDLTVITGFTDQLEKAAKQEAYVMARIAELRREGKWALSSLPKCEEPRRNKTHWDFVLEEVKWMAHDFRQERIIKKNNARKLCVAISKLHREKEQEVEKEAQRKAKDQRRHCALIAKMVNDFWRNVDKVVGHKKQAIIESKKRKALDQHLSFIVGEADKISQVVAEGIVEGSSRTPSIAGKDEDPLDKDFSWDESESDDERTIAIADKEDKESDVKGEMSALGEEADMDFEAFIQTLPPEYLAAYGYEVPPSTSDAEQKTDDKEEEETSTRPTTLSSGIEEEMATEDEMERESSNDLHSQYEDTLPSATHKSPQKAERVKLENVDFEKLKSENSDERQEELAHIAEEALKLQPKGYTLETTQVKTSVPVLLRGTLREYQMVGLDWLVTLYDKNLNGILADEMGLGKTIQTVALLAHLASCHRVWGPHLIVVPTSVILNWEMELKKWCPALKVLTYFGSVKERAEKRKGWMKSNSFHVCVTSYKVMTQDIRSFKMRSWQYLILDEAQNIKNWKSQRWQMLLNVRARRRLLLTGTPLQNSLMELWSLLHFLMPAIFASHDDFKDWFSNPLTGMMEGSVEFNKSLLDRLHKVLRPFILRRMKAEVEKQLPQKTEKVITCHLSKRQRFLYDDFMSQRETRSNLKSGNMMSVLNIVMQLRKCCNHPNLFAPREEETPLVTPPLPTRLPSLLFDIVQYDEDGGVVVPDRLDLRPLLSGWRTSVESRRALVEETHDELVPPPFIPSFTFTAPRHTSMQKVRGLPPGEMFLVVDDDKDIDGLDKVQVRVEGDKIVVNAGATGALRVCQAGPGGRMRDVSSSQHPRPVTSPLRADKAECTSSLPSTSQHSASPSIYATRRSYSQLQNGSSAAEQEGGSGGVKVKECIVKTTLTLSPPLKRKKRELPDVLQGPFKECVETRMKEALEKERDERMGRAMDRFGRLARPFYSSQLISLLWSETRSRRLGEGVSGGWSHAFWKGERAEVKRRLREEAEESVRIWSVVVDGASAEARGKQALCSSGRLACDVATDHRVAHLARTALNDSDVMLHHSLLSHKIAFPELRLIEYDCGKLQTLARLLRELFVYKHRCLIFTQMSKMLDVLQVFLSHHGYQYFRLDGTTPVEQRQVMMERFNADPRIFCFILSTRSGGVGINLTGADTVIFYDSDWNPTMDAQAQDRCHRIGQTRNVTIYRLISQRTIEENILKKANQKRRLGELAIDEAGFTPDFFRQKDNIRDLFDAEELGGEDVDAPSDAPSNQLELDKAMACVEDEADVSAAKKVRREANADRHEFDERVLAAGSALDSQDEQFGDLLSQLKPIERYAISFLEAEYKPEFEEEVKEAEALMVQKKAAWDRAHERAQAEEEEAERESDPLLSSINQPLIDEEELDLLWLDDASLPTWKPLTPPLSDSEDAFVGEECELLGGYEDACMSEETLSSTILHLPHPLAKYNAHATTTKQKQRYKKTSLPASSASFLDVAALLSADRDVQSPPQLSSHSLTHHLSPGIKEESVEGGAPARRQSSATSANKKTSSSRQLFSTQPKGDLRRPSTPPPAEREAKDYEGPDWSIMEDYALLQAVTTEQTLAHLPHTQRSALKLNWDYVSGFVNRVTRVYRSPRQCSLHYQMVVLPREESRTIAVDPATNKTKKLSYTPSQLVHLRKGRTTTAKQVEHDVCANLKREMLDGTRVLQSLRDKRPPPYRRKSASEKGLLTGELEGDQWEKCQTITAPLAHYDTPLALITYREQRREVLAAGMERARTDTASSEAAKSGGVRDIVIRPSAVAFQSGVLVTPPSIFLDTPPPIRMPLPDPLPPSLPPPSTPSTSLHPHSASASPSSTSSTSSMAARRMAPPNSHVVLPPSGPAPHSAYVVLTGNNGEQRMMGRGGSGVGAAGAGSAMYRGVPGARRPQQLTQHPHSNAIHRMGATYATGGGEGLQTAPPPPSISSIPAVQVVRAVPRSAPSADRTDSRVLSTQHRLPVRANVPPVNRILVSSSAQPSSSQLIPSAPITSSPSHSDVPPNTLTRNYVVSQPQVQGVRMAASGMGGAVVGVSSAARGGAPPTKRALTLPQSKLMSSPALSVSGGVVMARASIQSLPSHLRHPPLISAPRPAPLRTVLPAMSAALSPSVPSPPSSSSSLPPPSALAATPVPPVPPVPPTPLPSISLPHSSVSSDSQPHP